MTGTFVYRLVNDKFHSISIWQLWLQDDIYYFVGKGAVSPSESTIESLRRKYEKLFDAFNYPIIDIKDIKD
jgi:hypothetical protein